MSNLKLSNETRAKILGIIQEHPRDHIEQIEALILDDLAPRVLPNIDLPFGHK